MCVSIYEFMFLYIQKCNSVLGRSSRKTMKITGEHANTIFLIVYQGMKERNKKASGTNFFSQKSLKRNKKTSFDYILQFSDIE